MTRVVRPYEWPACVRCSFRTFLKRPRDAGGEKRSQSAATSLRDNGTPRAAINHRAIMQSESNVPRMTIKFPISIACTTINETVARKRNYRRLVTAAKPCLPQVPYVIIDTIDHNTIGTPPILEILKERFSRKVVPVSRSESNLSVVRRKEGNGRSVAKATELYTLLRSEKESLAKAKH
ncbi:hypothetical protein V1478_012272 [Vespula squamosa]|uniref:Uncharacterized protein n=1 Tax=Vespula squamosa TaxID=30214 RepID=A0ABD2ACT0_VESSQ